jgi:hypothetical protein
MPITVMVTAPVVGKLILVTLEIEGAEYAKR